MYISISSSPLELPAARMGRLPIRLQIRTGFTGPVVEHVQRGFDQQVAVPSLPSKRRSCELPTTRSGGIP